MQPIAALQLADDLVVGVLGGVLVDHRLVKVRIEWQAESLDGSDTLRLQDAAQLALHVLHALDPRIRHLVRWDRLQGTIEIVEDAQQLADEDRVAELADRGPLLVGASLEVAEVGRGALPVVEVLLVPGADVGQLALERLDALGELDPGRGGDGLGALLATGLHPWLGTTVGRVIGHWGLSYSLLMSSFMRVERYRTVGMARG